jgi:hypothetical protein
MLHKFVASAGNRSLRPLVVVPTTMSTALVPIGSFAMALVRRLERRANFVNRRDSFFR